MRRSWFVAAALAAAGGGAALTAAGDESATAKSRGPAARNVIYIQGDGMAVAQRELIRLATVGFRGELRMNRLPHSALVHTWSADPDEAVTDSAAAATAFATGHKTFNGGVGVDAKGRRVRSVLENARKRGKSTGLVTTSQVTDATPAAFGSHVKDRGDQSEIARQYIAETKPDVVLGGGEDWWLPAGTAGAYPDHPPKDPSEASKGTEGDLIAAAKKAGYAYVSDAAGLRAAKARKLLGLFANEELFEHRPEGEGDAYGGPVSLATMTRKALSVLDRDRDGFFLLVEEEGIDEMAHENNAHKLIEAGAALERAIGVALAYQRRHPRTLILVGGDHETGGLTIENVDAEDESGDALSAEDGPFAIPGSTRKLFADWTTGQHTGGDVAFTAKGPGAARVHGVLDNTDIHDVISRALKGGR
jgi:alkaline phosphatase